MHSIRKWFLGGLALALAAMFGCQKPPAPPPQQKAQEKEYKGENKPILNVDAGQSAAMHVNRAKVIQALKGDMNQLAQFYIQQANESPTNRGPANWQEFKAYMGNDGARYAKLVESNDVTVVYGVTPSTNTVVAYESKADLNGLQLVVFGDKRVESKKPDELKQALQNR